MLSIITLPGTTVSDLMANVGVLFSDLWTLLALAIGVPLAFYIIRKVISLVPKGR